MNFKKLEYCLIWTIIILVMILLYAAQNTRHIADDCKGHFVFELEGQQYRCEPIKPENIVVPQKEKVRF